MCRPEKNPGKGGTTPGFQNARHILPGWRMLTQGGSEQVQPPALCDYTPRTRFLKNDTVVPVNRNMKKHPFLSTAKAAIGDSQQDLTDHLSGHAVRGGQTLNQWPLICLFILGVYLDYCLLTKNTPGIPVKKQY